MADSFAYLQGKAKWFKHTAPNRFGDWSHDLYLTPESYDKLLKLKEKDGERDGILNTIKKDEDGYYVSFKRPTQKVFKGKVTGFAPPEVLDTENRPIHDVLVGNGSDITTKIKIYPYNKPSGGKGKAARWESSRIDNLVPFSGTRDFDADQAKAVKGLTDQPEQLF